MELIEGKRLGRQQRQEARPDTDFDAHPLHGAYLQYCRTVKWPTEVHPQVVTPQEMHHGGTHQRLWVGCEFTPPRRRWPIGSDQLCEKASPEVPSY